jgi:hypothetical protein
MRRTFTAILLGFFVTVQAGGKISVYKTPTCGCCQKWVAHLEANGFEVATHDMADLRSVKSMAGVQPEYASCHTAIVDGYVVEGHVPATDIDRLLMERPDIVGISVPGMPIGSPGMEHGDRRDNFAVITLEKDGSTKVFSRYGPAHD